MPNCPIEKWLEDTVGFENPKLGLSRVHFALEHLELSPKCKIITIAGTNGKGTTTRMIYNSLVKSGYNCAQFTSPHLKSITERFSYNQENISKENMLETLTSVYDSVLDKGVKLSFFEVLFVSFVKWSTSMPLDFLCLEVGLGGRYDATNAIDSDISVITSIARDHQGFLGNRYDGILAEKIGIARENKPLITNFSLDYLNSLVNKHQKTIGFKWYDLADRTTNNFIEANMEIALMVLDLLELKNQLEDPTKNTVKFYKDKNILLYGSHNLDAVRKLVQFLSYTNYNNLNSLDLVYLSFSARQKNEIDQMVKLYLILVNNNKQKIILTCFDHFKSANPTMIKEIAIENGIEFVTPDINIFENKKYKNILCSGSNYFVGSVQSKYNF